MSKAVKLLNAFTKLCRNSKGYDKWYQEKVKVISGGEGTAVCEMNVDQDMLNFNGFLHSGCLALIVDMATSISVATTPTPYPGVSVDISISYLSSAKLGDDILITSRVLKIENLLAFLNVEFTRKSDGNLIAIGKQTKYIWTDDATKERIANVLKNSLN